MEKPFKMEKPLKKKLLNGKAVKKKRLNGKPSGEKQCIVHDGKTVHYNNVKVTFLASSLW